jgi:FtsP/CotA-like multicopper oxidase with cupredoxin domain
MQTIRLAAFLLSLALTPPAVALEPSTGADRKQPMQALSQAVVDLKNGDRYLLRAQPVRKTIAGTPVRLYAYNGSVPGPLLRVRQGSTVTIDLVNALDQETAIDWDGVRTDETQDSARKAIPPKGTQRYVLQFPQPGLYWYHSQTNSQQDAGLYGNIQVLPRDSKAYGPVDREEMLVLGAFTLPSQARNNPAAAKTEHQNQIPLLNGEERYQLKVRAGERIRFYLTNAASARPFSLALPPIGLQRVGGNISRRPRAEAVDSIKLAPGDRAIVEATFTAPGSIPLIDDAANRPYELGRIEVVLATERRPAGGALKNLP